MPKVIDETKIFNAALDLILDIGEADALDFCPLFQGCIGTFNLEVFDNVNRVALEKLSAIAVAHDYRFIICH